MVPNAALILTPAVDFGTFLGLAREALGYSPAEVLDGSRRQCCETERYLTCLAALRDRKAGVGLAPHLLPNVSCAILAAADERDLLEILQVAAGMPFVIAETRMRGVQLAVITGTLAQWRDAVLAGAKSEHSINLRHFFNRVMVCFQAAGINIWKNCESHPLTDHTFYLTDK